VTFSSYCDRYLIFNVYIKVIGSGLQMDYECNYRFVNKKKVHLSSLIMKVHLSSLMMKVPDHVYVLG
jgi:hypothetical protein